MVWCYETIHRYGWSVMNTYVIVMSFIVLFLKLFNPKHHKLRPRDVALTACSANRLLLPLFFGWLSNDILNYTGKLESMHTCSNSGVLCQKLSIRKGKPSLWLCAKRRNPIANTLDSLLLCIKLLIWEKGARSAQQSKLRWRKLPPCWTVTWLFNGTKTTPDDVTVYGELCITIWGRLKTHREINKSILYTYVGKSSYAGVLINVGHELNWY